MTESKLSVEARATLLAPDGTPLGNLRHVVAAFADSDPGKLVVQATSNVYPPGPRACTCRDPSPLAGWVTGSTIPGPGVLTAAEVAWGGWSARLTVELPEVVR